MVRGKLVGIAEFTSAKNNETYVNLFMMGKEKGVVGEGVATVMVGRSDLNEWGVSPSLGDELLFVYDSKFGGKAYLECIEVLNSNAKDNSIVKETSK